MARRPYRLLRGGRLGRDLHAHAAVVHRGSQVASLGLELRQCVRQLNGGVAPLQVDSVLAEHLS
eukprot:8960424-Pyramimonas_sp.AAC.1